MFYIIVSQISYKTVSFIATTFLNLFIHKRFISYQSNRKENIYKYSISKKIAENPLILKKLKIYI